MHTLHRKALRLILLLALALTALLLASCDSGGGDSAGSIDSDEFTGTQAEEAATFAELMPADAILYASIRTDNAYLETLDGIIAKFYPLLDRIREMDDTTPPNSEFTMNNLLAQVFPEGQDTPAWTTDIRPWLGDTVAVAALAPDADGVSQVVIAFDSNDRAGALNFARQAYPNGEDQGVTESERDGFTVLTVDFGMDPADNIVIAANDEAMYFASSEALIPFGGAPSSNLAGSAGFSSALGRLPAPSYNIIGYLDATALSATSETLLDDSGLPSPTIEGALVFGATIAEGRTMIIDVATDGAQVAAVDLVGIVSTPVDTGFHQYIPADASMVIHGSNLRLGIDEALELAAAEDETLGEQLEQLDTLLDSFLQLDFQNDLLGLLEGEYVAFLTVETDSDGMPVVLNSVMAGSGSLGIEGGIILETTNAENAAQLISGTQGLLALAGDLGEGISITTGEVAGVDAIIISVEDPSLPAPLEIVAASNSDVIVIATRRSAEQALQGEGGLGSADLYEEAERYLLDDATTIWYLDRAGTISGVGVVGLTLLGPAIGNIFEDILDELSLAPTGEATYQFTQDDMADPMDLITGLIGDLNSAFNSMTISTATDSNDIIVRFVLTFSE